jgi:hypothetical protein
VEDCNLGLVSRERGGGGLGGEGERTEEGRREGEGVARA